MTGNKPQGERRIPKSGEGRLRFTRGDAHSLDVQMDEAQRLAALLTETAAPLTPLLAELEQHQQIGVRLAEEDQMLTEFLTARYKDRKHIDHIVATLRIFRIRRAQARLEAAQEALRLAGELLTPDPLVGQLVDLLQQLEPDASLNREELTGSPRLIDEQIEQTKAHLKAIQAALSRSNGWIEQQFVKRKHYRDAAVAYLRALGKQKRNTTIPEDVRKGVSRELAEVLRKGDKIPPELEEEAFYEEHLGPYFFFRWREDGHVYSICLSDITVEMPERFRVGGLYGIRTRGGVITIDGKPVE